MAPTGRYPPGQLVWIKVRSDIAEFDYDGSYTPRMDVANFKVGLVIRDATTATLWSGHRSMLERTACS